MGGQKKMYNRWHSIMTETALMNKCRLVSNSFSTLNYCIKAVCDNAFIENKETAIKEKALMQLFKNLHGNMAESFKRWREAASIARIQDQMTNQEKAALLKMLENLLQNGRTAKIREAIEKFRTNRRITDIQRNFLKRLLQSKAGLVVVAFKKIQTLPERRDDALYTKANKFEKGLSTFVERTLRRPFNAFKT